MGVVQGTLKSFNEKHNFIWNEGIWYVLLHLGFIAFYCANRNLEVYMFLATTLPFKTWNKQNLFDDWPLVS